MFGRFKAAFENIDLRPLNVVVCGIFVVQYVGERYVLKSYFEKIIEETPLPASSAKYDSAYMFEHMDVKIPIYPKGGPTAVEQAMEEYFIARNFYPGAILMQPISLSMINMYILRGGKNTWLPCSLLLIGNMMLTITNNLSGVRFYVLMEHIQRGEAKVYENFAELRLNQRKTEISGFERFFTLGGLASCFIGSLLASPGSVAVVSLAFLLLFRFS